MRVYPHKSRRFKDSHFKSAFYSCEKSFHRSRYLWREQTQRTRDRQKRNGPVEAQNKQIWRAKGRRIVGRPTALMLQNEHCTVTMCDKYTQHLVRELQGAEILVSATGVPHLIGLREVQACHPKVVVIDAGFSKRDGKLMGDVDFHTVHDHVGAITPVPGGVGPMTVAMLTRNMLKAARANQAVRTISEKSTSRR